MLEFAVDIILLHHDKTNTSGWKIFQWSQSEKLKAAETIVNFFKADFPPDQFEAQTKFYAQQKTFIEESRKTLWGVVKHPARWTGRSDLFRDIVEADKLSASVIENTIGMSLARYYRTEYRKLNWFIHSGAAAFGGLPPPVFNLISADMLRWSADLAMLSTKIVLVDFGFYETLKLDEEWADVKRKRLVAYTEKMRHTKRWRQG